MQKKFLKVLSHFLKASILGIIILFLFSFASSVFASDLYWVGGTGSWSDTNHWSTISGGVGGAGKPGAGDTAVFDANSAGGTCTLNEAVSITALNMQTGNTTAIDTSAVDSYSFATSGDFIAVSGAFTANSSIITVGGNWNSSTGIFNYGTSTVVFTGSGKTLTTAATSGKGFYNLTINSGASITAQSGFTINNLFTISGTFNIASAKTVNIANTSTANLIINTGGVLGGAGTLSRLINDFSSHITNKGTISIGTFIYSINTISTAAPITATTYKSVLKIYSGVGKNSARAVLCPAGSTLNLTKAFYIGISGKQGVTLDNSVNNIPVVSSANLIIGTLSKDSKLIAGSATYSFNNVTVNASDASHTNEIDADTSTWKVKGKWTNNDTFAADTSTVILNGTNQTISGNTTFYNLTKTVTSSATLTFKAGNTQTIFNTLTLQGASGKLLSLRSTTLGSQWMTDPQGSRNISFVDVKDSKNINPATIVATDSIDSGNNVGWNFVGKPTAITEPATDINDNSATLNATVNPNSLDTTTYFEWGTTPFYGNVTPSQSTGSGTNNVSVATNLTGLSIGTYYYYRVVATNTKGTSYGLGMSFTTTATSLPPFVSTSCATDSTSNSAQLCAQVNPNGSATTVYFEWGLTTSYGNTTPIQSIGSGTSPLSVTAIITGLSPDTVYHYRVVATNANGTSYSPDTIIITKKVYPPAADSISATNVTSNSATLNAFINPRNSATTAYFAWGIDTTYGNITPTQSIGSGDSVISISANLTGLSPSTTYHYRIVATNANGTSYGLDMSFTTDAATSLLPDTTTNPATKVYANSALLNATVNPNGSAATVYFEWGTTISYGNISTSQSIGNGTSNVSVADTLLGLLPNTTYHYRIVATNANGTSYGNNISFTTGSGTDVSGTISTNTTWTLAGSPYIVTGTISIYDPTVTLTIESGVVVKFNAETSLYIYRGILNARGTAAAPILFTSNQQNPAPGYWYGISFDSSSGENIFEYVTVEYGGYNAFPAIYQYNTHLTIKNSTIRYNSNGGIYVVGNSNFTTTTIIDSDISNNGAYGIYTGWGSLWGTVDVSISGSTITNNGVYGIYIYDGSNISVTNSTISNNGTYGVYIDSYIYDLGTYQAPYISNTSFENNTTYPISMVPYSAGNLGAGNTYNNNGTDGIELRGSYIESDVTLPYQSAPYIVTNGIWVGSFQAMPTLTIAPGVVIKFNAGKSLEVSGVLKAQGTSSAPIVFTSNQNPAQPGDWYGIRFYNHAATESILEYATVEYGGYGGYGNIYLSNNSPTIKNSAIKNSNNYGIYSSGDSSPIITGSTISTNGIHGVYTRGTGKADITFSTFISNTNYAVYSEIPVLNVNHNNIENNGNGIYSITGQIADARFNWWGDATGPSGKGNGTGQSISSGINFEPWLSTLFTYPFYNIDLSASLQEFSPLNNSVNYTFSISENSNWTFSLKNSGGTAIKTFTSSGTGGTIAWDGKDGNGVIVPDGIYTYQLESISLSNGSQSAPLIGDATVGLALPKAEITSPVHGQFIGLFDIQGTATDSDFKDYKVEYGLGTAPETWTLITSSTTQINNGTLATWNPSVLTGTYYTIRLSVNDLAGNTATDSVEVQLLMNNLWIDPSNFSPNGDGFEDTIKITAQLSQPKDWTLNIKNSDGTLIKSFSGSGTSLLVMWDGTDTAGVIQPEGVYPFTITTVDTALGAGEITIDFSPSPEAITDDVVTFWTNSATLEGSVNPRGFETIVYFEWGTNNNPYENRTTSASIGSGTQFIRIQSNLIGLSPGMTYHYRVVATNANGTSYGSDKIFITRGTTKPDAITDFATNITDSSVTLNATVNPRGAITTAYFEWGTNISYGNTTSVQSIGYGTESVSISSNITQLLPNTTYHYRVVATNDNGITNGLDQSFTTSGVTPPTATTNPATNINGNFATLNATVNPNNSATTVYFEWGTTISYGNTTSSQSIGSGTSNISVTTNLTGLLPSTTYHYRVAAANAGGTNYGNGMSFTTPPMIITITSPLDGETIYRPDVMVKGTVSNTTGNETGVTVNGIVASVYGNEFIANHVPLTEGTNTITATATDTAGNTAKTSITVNAVTTSNYIQLTANPESGISPLEVILKIDGSFSITNSTITYTGPAQPETLYSSADEYRIRMTVEGIYYFTANVTGPDSNTYQDTVAVVVLNATQLDALLRAKWEAMNTALIAGDITTALTYFPEEYRTDLGEAFNFVKDQLPAALSQPEEFNLISITDNFAKYENVVYESGGVYSYPVLFIKDVYGIWRIRSF